LSRQKADYLPSSHQHGSIDCIDDVGTNAPLVSGELKLEFQHVFLRPAIPPKEKVHIEIRSETPMEWAKNLWFIINKVSFFTERNSSAPLLIKLIA
jgi:hypothetical protein